MPPPATAYNPYARAHGSASLVVRVPCGGRLSGAPTARETLRDAAASLKAAGVRDADWDAELLLRHVLGWSRADLIARSAEPLPVASALRFAALLARRAAREPLQHLTGVQAFWRHEFAVSPDVLVPRPGSELVVELALAELSVGIRALVIDVGTGSGCLALSIAAERPLAQVIAIDLSPAALEVARLNARRLDLEGRVSWREGDLLAPAADFASRVDLIVCNPPYVDPAEPLEPEVRDHEPALALFPPGDVLSVYRRLWPQVATALRPGGLALVEVGAGQANAVKRLAAAAGLIEAEPFPDLQGIPRVVRARRPG